MSIKKGIMYKMICASVESTNCYMADADSVGSDGKVSVKLDDLET